MVAGLQLLRHRSAMGGDPFSDVLALVEATTVLTRGFVAGGSWSLRFPPPNSLKFSVVARGRCWLGVDGRSPTWLEQGDIFLLSGKLGFTLADASTTEPKDARQVLGHKPREPFVELGRGRDCMLLSGAVGLQPTHAKLLTEVLPDLVVVRAVSPKAAPLRWIVEQLLEECHSTVPGAAAASAQLAQLLFVQLLRAHVGSAGTLPPGWLRAMADARLLPALVAMHRAPEESWALAELAKLAGMSRTSFAVRFKAAAGVAPAAYLTGWRMQLAQRRLSTEDVLVSEIGSDLGYSSESAFSHAFKRVVGCSPRAFRDQCAQTRTLEQKVRTLEHSAFKP